MTTPDLDPLILALIAERERRGLGIRETARLCGMGHMPGRLSEWELGYVTPNLRGLRKWATGLGLDLALITLTPAAILHTDQHGSETT